MSVKDKYPYRVRLAKKLKALSAGMTQREFSKRSGIHQGTLNRYLNCYQSASLDKLQTLCQRLKIDIVDLFAEESGRENDKKKLS